MTQLETDSRSRVLAGSLLGTGIALVVVLFVILNYFGWKYHTRLDWTRNELFTLSEKSEQVLASLDRDVEAVVFLSPVDELYGPVTELLARYESTSERVSVRIVDPEKNLAEAQSLVDRYELSNLNVVVFDAEGNRRIVDTSDLADYDYSGMQMGQGPSMTGFKGEQVFTGALVDLMESRKLRVLFTIGHGEALIDDFSPRGMTSARDLLVQDNFDVDAWPSLGEGEVPAGTDLVVIAGPTSSFIAEELTVLRSYLDSGGRLLILLDPTLGTGSKLVPTGLESLLVDFGVDVGADIVVDPASPLPFFSAETIFVSAYGDHVITRSLDQAQLPVIVPLARSVRAGEPVEGLRATELMMTTVEGWGETDLENLDKVGLDGADTVGPVSIAVAVESVGSIAEPAQNLAPSGELSEAADLDEPSLPAAPDMRLVVVGDTDFASNAQLQNVPNATLFANALNWLAEREALVGIPPKNPEQVRLSLSQPQLARITWLVLLGLPALSIVLGIAVYMHRRR